MFTRVGSILNADSNPQGVKIACRFTIIIIVLALVASIVAALQALLVKEITEPPYGEKSADMMLDVVANANGNEADQLLRLANELIGMWKKTNAELKRKLTIKAEKTRAAQYAVTIAAVLSAALAILHPYIQLTSCVR